MGDVRESLTDATSGRRSSVSFDDKASSFDVTHDLHTVTDLHSRGATAFGKQVTSTNDVRTAVKADLEQNKSSASPKTVRQFAFAYLLCLLLVLLLSLACQLVISTYIRRAEKDSYIVNEAGKQRYRSQKIAKDALAILLLRREGLNSDNYTSALATDTADFTESYYGLLQGSKPLDLPGSSDHTIQNLYRQIDPYFQSMKVSADSILALPVDALPTAVTPGSLTASVNALLAAEPLFLDVQIAITTRFTSISKDHLKFLLILTWVLHSSVILTLILEGVLVFYPLIRRTQSLINERFNYLRANYVTEAQARSMASFTIGYVTHQIEKPLASITHLLDRALSKDAAADKAADGEPAVRASENEASRCGPELESLKKCLQNCELMQTIVEDVSDIRLLENGRMNLALEKTNVVEHIGNVLITMGPQIDARKVTLITELDPVLKEKVYWTDGQRLEQILINLIAKAIKVAPSGTVVVRAKTQVCGLRFEVEDNGNEMLEGTQHRMFELFDAETKHLAAGTELGLYISKLLVELMGGKIGLGSTPSEGNVLWFELPLLPYEVNETGQPMLERYLSDNSMLRGPRTASGGRSRGSSLSQSRRVHTDIATLVREEDGSMRWEEVSPKVSKGDELV